jgi:anhydro-N-acetylmuramic acid kinase
MIERLASHLPNADILPSNEYGIPIEAKEAIGFAVLGYAFMREMYANMPAATGADKKVILGRLTP